MAKEVRIPDIDALEEPRFGMNDLDAPKKLLQHVSQQLVNAFPGISVKPRNGVTEIIHNTEALGYPAAFTLLYPEMVQIEKDGKLYVIAWHHNFTNRNLHGIEVWNITDGTRTTLDLGNFSGTDVHVSFKKLYGAVYMAIETEFSSNSVSSYRTISKILDFIDGAWVVREMGINIAPAIQNIFAVNAEGLGLWDGRAYYASCVWNNEVWIVGGVNDNGFLNSVVHSSDGGTWITEVVNCEEQLYDDEANELVYDEGGEVVTVDSTMPSRSGWKLVPFGDYLLLIGGADGTECYNDIWFTDDGTNWYQYGIDPTFPARKDFAICEHDGYLWISGGKAFDGTPMSDVWRSSDGFTWNEVSQVSGFTARGGHVMLSYSGYLWIQGGTGTNIYRSTDGATWTEVAADAGLGTRSYHGAVVYNARMWVAGGIDTVTPKNDVYSSTDGITWTLAQGSADFSARYGMELFNFLNDLYIVAGYTGTTYEGNVYHSNDGITWTALSTGIETGKFYNHAFTFIRRTDEYAKLASIDDFVYESWETYFGTLYVGVDETLLTGTVSLSGTALTGTGTLFSTELIEGAFIRIDGVPRYVTIEEITDDTNAVVTNVAGDSFTDKNFVLLPAVGDAVTTDTFLPGECEGIEDEDYRRVIYTSTTTDYCRIFSVITASAAAQAKGATHVRVYRSLKADTSTVAEGLSLRYRADIALGNQKVFRDSLSDDLLAYVTNSLEMEGMSAPPSGRYTIWHDGRLWIGGNSNLPGYWFASNISANTQYPQKYASAFNLEDDFITCDPDDGQRDSGGFEFLGDLYFCKERKIFGLARGDIDNNIVDTVSHAIGVAFPNSIAFGIDPNTGKQAVYFLSESGPAVMTAGGKVRLLTEFRIKQLWPGTPGTKDTIFRTSAGVTTTWYSRNRVFGVWFRDTYWVIFGDSQDTTNQFSTPKMYGLHYANDGQSYGGFKYEYALPTGINSTIYEPMNLIPVSNIEAYAFSHKRDAGGNQVYRVVKYSDANTFTDTFNEGTAKIVVKWEPRPFTINMKNYYEMLWAQRVLCHVDYDDSETLDVTISPDESRIVNKSTYTQVRQSGLISTDSALYRQTEVIVLKDGIKGTRFSILMEKTIPDDGDVEIHCPQVDVMPTSDEFEFQSSGSEITGLTFVEKTGTTPEVDAYAV